MAYAFDLLGERWTFLIIRELFLGPQRFGDLHGALPGIGTNLLSKRLKELEEAGLVRATSSEPRSSYRLTEDGEELRPAVREIVFWSIKYFMSRPENSEPKECIFSNDLRPDSVAMALEMFANKSSITHDNYVLQVLIDDMPYTFYFMTNEMTVLRGGDTPALAKLTTDVATMMQAMRGEIHLQETLKRSSWSGNEAAINHFLASITPGSDVAFEVAEFIKQRKLEKTVPQHTPSKEAAEA